MQTWNDSEVIERTIRIRKTKTEIPCRNFQEFQQGFWSREGRASSAWFALYTRTRRQRRRPKGGDCSPISEGLIQELGKESRSRSPCGRGESLRRSIRRRPRGWWKCWGERERQRENSLEKSSIHGRPRRMVNPKSPSAVEQRRSASPWRRSRGGLKTRSRNDGAGGSSLDVIFGSASLSDSVKSNPNSYRTLPHPVGVNHPWEISRVMPPPFSQNVWGPLFRGDCVSL